MSGLQRGLQPLERRAQPGRLAQRGEGARHHRHRHPSPDENTARGGRDDGPHRHRRRGDALRHLRGRELRGRGVDPRGEDLPSRRQGRKESRAGGLRREAQHHTLSLEARHRSDDGALGLRLQRHRVRRPLHQQRPGRPQHVRDAGGPREGLHADGQAHLRHLHGQPDTGSGRRRRSQKAEIRPSRPQPAREGSGHHALLHHDAKPRIRRRHPHAEGGLDAPLREHERRFERRHTPQGDALVLGTVSPRSLRRSGGHGVPLRHLCRPLARRAAARCHGRRRKALGGGEAQKSVAAGQRRAEDRRSRRV